MDFFIKTDEQHHLMEKINKLIPVFQEREPELDELHSFPYKNIEDLKKINYHTLTLPKEDGGQGLGLYEFILAQEAISKGCGSTGLSIGWHTGMVLEYAENKHWNEDVAKWLVEEIKKGALINSAATESNAGSPTRGAKPRTTFVSSGDEFVVNGEKTYTSMAPVLDYIFVTATNENGDIESVIIPKKNEGVSIRKDWDMLSMRGTASDTLVLKDVRIPKSYIIKSKDKMKPKARGWLLHIPACYLGIAGAARDYAIKFATSYVPLSIGKPIAEVPNIKQTIGEIELELLQARHLLYSTVERYERAENKEDVSDLLNMTKIAVTNGAMTIVDKAMRIVGSRALSASNPMHRYYLNVRAGLYNPPMEDLVKNQFATKAIESFYEKK